MSSLSPWRAVAAAGAVCVSLGGCGGVKRPAIAPAGVSVIELNEGAATIGVAVELRNPNDEELELREFNYRVEIAGREVYAGRRAAQATLPARGSRVIELPAVVHLDTMAISAIEADGVRYAIRGSLTYLAPGAIAEILFDSGVRKPEVRFGHEGIAPLASGR